MNLPLYPPPRPTWQAERDAVLAGSAYIRKKYNREKSIREHVDFYRKYLPEIDTNEGHGGDLIVDIGCGMGVGLEMLRSYGWDTIGVEAPSGEGGMGDAYHRLSRALHERQKLAVTYVGWQAWVEAAEIPPESVFAFVSRGSWEQCFAEHLMGPPHHEHHECKRQDWDKSQELVGKWHLAFEFMYSRLSRGGLVLIHANGTGTTDVWYDDCIRAVADASGFRSTTCYGLRLHKWRKADAE